MEKERGGIGELGLYDDFDYSVETNEVESEGLFSPFTFLCFAIILALTGLLTLLSSSYDSALSGGRKFYALFLEEGAALAAGIITGIFVSFIPLSVLKRTYAVTFPLYIILFSVSFFTDYLSSLRAVESIALLGTMTLLFAFSDITSLIIERKRGGISLIILTLITLSVLISQTILGGSGWFLLSSFVIVSSLSALTVRKSYILYVVLCLVLIFAFIFLLDGDVLNKIESSIMAVTDKEYYSKDLYYSHLAIKEGGIDGVGIGSGLYKLGLIDDVEGQYIFASFFEETGIGGLMVILFSSLFIMIIGLRSSDRAFKREEKFISSFTFSGIVLIVFSFLINILYVSGILPFSGVPLLLFSYNPVSEVMTVILIALLYKFIFRMGRENA